MDNNNLPSQPSSQPQPDGDLAKTDYNYGSTPVNPYPGQPAAYPQPGPASEQAKPQPGYPPLMNIQQAYRPQYGQSTAVRPYRNPNVAFLLELLGYVGFLGFGHIYAGNVIGGIILLLFGWGIAGFLFWVGALLSIFTLGLGLCLLVPLFLAVPLISGFFARGIAVRSNYRSR
jgi:hypothetical protein